MATAVPEGLSCGASATLGTLSAGSGASFSVLSLSEKFSAVLESSDEDSYLGRKHGRSEETPHVGKDMGSEPLTYLHLDFPNC